MPWNDVFLWRSWAASLIMAALASPVGCLMIWRRMAYFSDTLSHSALTGIMLGLMLGISQNIGVFTLVGLLALIFSKISHRFIIGVDLLLLIVGQTALCIGIIGLSYMENVRSDLMGYLFGDVLSVTNRDLVFILCAGGVCAVLLALNWRKQVFVAVSPDIAQSEGVPPEGPSALFMLITALFVALALKTTGLLLVSALLIIPPATARFFSKTPEQMAFLGSLIGIAGVTAGMAASALWDAPAAPAMETACAFLFSVACVHDRCHKKII